MIRRCPVCRQFVPITLRRNIAGHLDSLGRDTCPMTGQAYQLTLIAPK